MTSPGIGNPSTLVSAPWDRAGASGQTTVGARRFVDAEIRATEVPRYFARAGGPDTPVSREHGNVEFMERGLGLAETPVTATVGRTRRVSGDGVRRER